MRNEPPKFGGCMFNELSLSQPGGHGLNIVPESATVSVDYRVTTPGEAGVSEDVEEVVSRLTSIADATLGMSKHCVSHKVINVSEPSNPLAIFSLEQRKVEMALSQCCS